MAIVTRMVGYEGKACHCGDESDCLSNLSYGCQSHSSLDSPSELNPPQRIPSPLYTALLVPQAEG